MEDKRLPGLSQATIKRLEEHYRQHPTRRRLEEVVEAAETVETLLVNAEPGTGDKQLKDYYDKHREHGLQKRRNPPSRPRSL